MTNMFRTFGSSFRATSSVMTIALLLALSFSSAQASSDYIVYQGVAFDDGMAVASTDIALRFTLLASDGTTVVYRETQADVPTTDKGFFFHQIGSGAPVVVDSSAATYAAIIWADGYKLRVEVDYANGTSYTDLGIQEFSSSVYAIRAKTARQLATARTIGGVSFDGTGNIDLPGVNAAGTQNTTGNAATATTLTGLTSTVAELNYVDGVTSAIQTQLDGKEPSFTKNTGFNRNFGTGANTVTQGNDARLSNARNSIAHAHGQISSTGAITSAAVAPASTDYLIISDASGNHVLRRGVLIGTGTATYLRNNGTWGTPPNTNTTYRAGTGLILSGTTFTNTAPHVATNLGFTAGTTAGPTITSSTGNNATIPTASATASGVVTIGAQTFNGNKTFSGTVTVSGANRLGVGTTSPGYPIHVAATAQRSGGTSYFAYGVTSPDTGSNSTTRDVGIYASRFIAGFAFLAFSDTRIKEDITPITNAISTLQSLEPVSYTKVDKVANGSGLHYGFIAQDLETIIPEAVSKGYGEVPVLKMFDDVVFEEGARYTILVKNAEEETQQEYTTGQQRPEGEVFVINKKVDDFRTVDHNMILAQAVAAIQEQQVLIETLQNELKEIKEELRATNQSNR